MSEIIVRPLRADDAHAAGIVVDSALARTRYHGRARELLASTLGFDDDEHLGLIASASAGASAGTHDPHARGLALFGRVAGALGVMRLHALLDAHGSLLGALLREVLTSAATDTRLIVCELPEDTPFEPLGRTLTEAGFVEEGRIADLVADGVAMRLLVRRTALATET